MSAAGYLKLRAGTRTNYSDTAIGRTALKIWVSEWFRVQGLGGP